MPGSAGTNPPPSDLHRPDWSGLIALFAAAALNWLLPDALSAGPGWLAVAFVAVMALATALIPRWHVPLAHTTLAAITCELAFSLFLLVRNLVLHLGDPASLLVAAVVIWSMNVLVFASWYWLLDSGGPHRRAGHEVYSGGAFLFPQFSLPLEVRRLIGAQDWRPRFIDYLFLAFTTSTAFSPTDVPVLSGWAKVLVMIQASISLTTLAVVATRAINIL